MNKNKIYNDNDVLVNVLKDKVVGVIGYGNQARAQALNLKDSGINVLIGLRDNSLSKAKSLNDGFSNAISIKELVQKSDLICFLIPDEEIPSTYLKFVKNYLKPKQTLVFAHGYCIHFKKIQVPSFVNIIMVAPSGAGKIVREKYINNSGVPNLIAVNQDFTKNSFDIALSYSKSIGGTRIGSFVSSFKEETITDIFGEQSILTGGLPALMRNSFDVLVESGYSPTVAWFVCYYEVKSIVELFHKDGFEYLNKSISNIAEYGGLTRGEFLINKDVKLKMKEMLKEIESGSFVSEWDKEKNDNNSLLLNEKRAKVKNSKIEKINKKMIKILFDK
jgi:ketol-acid reductoisomerase